MSSLTTVDDMVSDILFIRGNNDAWYTDKNGDWEKWNHLDDLPVHLQFFINSYSTQQFEKECMAILNDVTKCLLNFKFAATGQKTYINNTGFIE